MALLKSTYVRRKGTGRKPKHVRIRHRAVHTRRHRRFRGIRSAPLGSQQRNRARALALVAQRKAAAARKQVGRTALLRSKARAVALRNAERAVAARRNLPAGRKRAYYGRKVPKGLKRKYYGRKKSTKPPVRKIGSKPTPARGPAISPQSYINMF